jgi:predicted dehydrogenase
MVGFNRRFSPLAVEMQKRLAGRGGPCIMTYRVNGGLIPKEHWIQHPEEGGGRLVGEACHFIDLMQFLTGAAPAELAAMGVEDADSRYGADDACTLIIKFSDGSVGNLVFSALGNKAVAKEQLEVLADGAIYSLDNFRSLNWCEGGKSGKTRLKTQAKGFDQEVAAFMAHLLEQGPPPIGLESLLSTTKATFAALESLFNGTVVRL